MQQAGEYLRGDWDYTHVRGDTGPCVYPGIMTAVVLFLLGGHVHLYALFSLVTQGGANIHLAQYLFAGIYVLFIGVLLLIYRKANTSAVNKPVIHALYFCIALCMSRRIHSIFVLRLFNDSLNMLFLYLSIVAFIYDKWSVGCFLFRYLNWHSNSFCKLFHFYQNEYDFVFTWLACIACQTIWCLW